MINKFQTCYGCPDRSLTCRSACDGWQYREAQKQVRYAESETRYHSYPTHARQEREQNRWKKLGLKGISTK